MKSHGIIMQPESVRMILDSRKSQTRRLLRKSDRDLLDFIAPEGADRDDPANWGYSFEGPRRQTWWAVLGALSPNDRDDMIQIPPPVAVGHTLWVREQWMHSFAGETTDACHYMADAGTSRWLQCRSKEDALRSWPGRWRSSLLMPRWASRLTLEVGRVRVERVQKINEADAVAEGCEPLIFEEWVGYDPETQSYPSFNVDPGPDRGVENVRHHVEQIATAAQMFARGWDTINGKRASWASNPFVYVYDFRVVANEALARSA